MQTLTLQRHYCVLLLILGFMRQFYPTLFKGTFLPQAFVR